jgi:hypothetical protein
MDDEEEILWKREHDSLPDPIDAAELGPCERVEGRIDGSKHERTQNHHALQAASDQMASKGVDIDDDVRQLGHAQTWIEPVGGPFDMDCL